MRMPTADGFLYERGCLQCWFASGRHTSAYLNTPIQTEVRVDLTMRAYASAWT